MAGAGHGQAGLCLVVNVTVLTPYWALFSPCSPEAFPCVLAPRTVTPNCMETAPERNLSRVAPVAVLDTRHRLSSLHHECKFSGEASL